MNLYCIVKSNKNRVEFFYEGIESLGHESLEVSIRR